MTPHEALHVGDEGGKRRSTATTVIVVITAVAVVNAAATVATVIVPTAVPVRGRKTPTGMGDQIVGMGGGG